MDNNKIITALVAGAAGFFLGWVVFSSTPVLAPDSETGQASLEESVTGEQAERGLSQPTALGTASSLKVENQAAGDQALIAAATLEDDAWIAVHENRDGMPGNILGASKFPAGVSSHAVTLLRPTVAGNTYYAMLHRDSGDDEFDFKGADGPLTDGSGKPVMTAFSVFAAE